MADPQLDEILNRQKLRSEGEESVHCFIKSPPRSPDHGSSESPVRRDSEDWYEEETFDDETPPLADVGVGGCAGSTPSKSRTDLSTAAADIAAGSPHFSLETPPNSPRERKASESLEEDAKKEENNEGAEDDVQYEWQFEIMNGLPPEKAVKLVNFLKKSERQRAQASATVDQLQKEVVRLSSEKDLDTSPSIAEPVAEMEESKLSEQGSRQKGRCHPLSWIIAALAVLVGCSYHFYGVLFDDARTFDERPAILLDDAARPVDRGDLENHADEARVVAGVEDSIAVESKSVNVADVIEATPIAKQSGSLEALAASTTVTTTSSSVMPVPVAAQAPPAPQAGVRTGPLSASVYGHPVLQMLHPALAQDVAAPVDASAELGGALAFFPLVKSAIRLGRVVLNGDNIGRSRAVLTCTVTILNDGLVSWPAETLLRLVMGPDLGLSILDLGQVMHPGAPAELSMQFEIPYENKGQGMMRSGWILESRGEPFGPLLLLESQVL